MELAEYVLETLRRDGEFRLSRGQHRRCTDASPPSILALTPVSERPALGTLRRMERDYAVRAELDPAWAVPHPMPSSSAVAGAANPAVTLRDAERAHIRRTLEESRWVISGAAGAAARLGLKRPTRQALVKRLGLERPRSQADLSAPAESPAGMLRHSSHAAHTGTGRTRPAAGS